MIHSFTAPAIPQPGPIWTTKVTSKDTAIKIQFCISNSLSLAGQERPHNGQDRLVENLKGPLEHKKVVTFKTSFLVYPYQVFYVNLFHFPSDFWAAVSFEDD